MSDRTSLPAYVQGIIYQSLTGIKQILSTSNSYLQGLVRTANAAAVAAANSASSASNSATSATSSAGTATAAMTKVTALMLSFTKQWYGDYPSDPSTDPNGDPPIKGAGYYNTAEDKIRVFNGTYWEDYDRESQVLTNNAQLAATQSAASAASAHTDRLQCDADLAAMQKIAGPIVVPNAGLALDYIRVKPDGSAYEPRTPGQVLSDIGGASTSYVNGTFLPLSGGSLSPPGGGQVYFGSYGYCSFYMNSSISGNSMIDFLSNQGGGRTVVASMLINGSIVLRAGGTFQGTATSAEYGDLAEKYTTDRQYPPGTIMAFAPTSSDKETTCALQGSSIIGVISTAPGLMINQKLKSGQLIGIIGRVPTRVIGKVSRGDPISLSTIPGVGEVGADYFIGYAVESCGDEGEKLVETTIFPMKGR